jgi:hypothetical protein
MPAVNGDRRLLRIPLFDRVDLDTFIDKLKAGSL